MPKGKCLTHADASIPMPGMEWASNTHTKAIVFITINNINNKNKIIDAIDSKEQFLIHAPLFQTNSAIFPSS